MQVHEVGRRVFSLRELFEQRPRRVPSPCGDQAMPLSAGHGG